MTPTSFALAQSAYVPLGLAFFGLGTGYLIFGPQELFGFPAKSESSELTNGWWGFWMPGMLQFLCGTYILVGLTWFNVFGVGAKATPLYAAGIETTVFGIHWLAMGLSRMRGGSIVPNGFMSVAFFLVSLLGLIVFKTAGDGPVTLLFAGLMAVYFCLLDAASGTSAVPESGVTTTAGSNPATLGPVSWFGWSAVSSSRPDRARGVVHSRGQEWPQAIA
ncbi:hypothetical protein ACMS1Z_15080 [Acidiphilium multivorum]|uniref:hypothetical protein n=1 Tax=Acidiphilium multivorum TaxID=62140 RepID=UPI0039C92DEC